MSRRFAQLVVRLRYPIVGAWVAAAVAATLLLPSIDAPRNDALGQLVPADADAIETERRAYELFGFPLLSRTLVVQRDPDGLSAAAHARVVERTIALNRREYPGLHSVAGALAITNALGKPPFSRESSTTAITYLFFRADIGRDGQVGLAQRLIDRHISRPADGRVGVTGAIPARAERVHLIEDNLVYVHIATLLLVTLVVAVHFRALAVPFVNLAAVALAFLISTRVAAGLGSALGITVPKEVTPVVVALLFGVITDYVIFFLAPLRRRLRESGDRRRVTVESIAEQLPIVVAAGITVVAATMALAAAKLELLQAFGPGVAIAALIGLLAAITFVPAVVVIAGRTLFWPLDPEKEGRDDGKAQPRRRFRIPALAPLGLRLAARRPLPVIVTVTVVLLALASGLTQAEVGNPLMRGLPRDSDVRQAYIEAGRGFARGILSPTMVVVEGPGITRRRAALTRFQRLLEDERGVAAVGGPREDPVGFVQGAVYSETGNAARLLVVFDADPLGGRATQLVERLERRAPGLLAEAGLPRATASFAGDSALVAETVAKARDDLVRVAPVALLAVVIVLGILLRAVVAPLYLVAASVLALAAGLGLTSWVFQGLVGWPELTFFTPLAAAVLLLALGSDYNVFIAGRIWAEARRRPLPEAVAVAGERSAGAVTAAGLVLAASFAIVAIIPLRAFRELAFAMSAGLLIDAFVVRTLLVPALIVLVGERGGWPGNALSRRARAGP